MPEPEGHPNLPQINRAGMLALFAGVGITGLKFAIFWRTSSVAVLSDALESIINTVAAGVLLLSNFYSSRPADRSHPYGHGKVEFLAVGFEGILILVAGLAIGYEALKRLIVGGPQLTLDLGLWMLAGVAVLMLGLALAILRSGRKYHNPPLVADGKHLLADVWSTVAVFLGLLLVRLTGLAWLDPLVAIIVAIFIFSASWKLLWQSFHGLIDGSDPEDEKRIVAILEDEIARGRISGYHKVRHRHNGSFHWIDMHLQVNGRMSIDDGHRLASEIEGRIERSLGRANATAHLEPNAEKHLTMAEGPGSSSVPSDRNSDDGSRLPGTEVSS